MSEYEKHHPHHQGPPDWEEWDWNSILRVTLLIGFSAVVILCLVYGPEALKKYREKTLDVTTTAKITKVKSDKNMYQGLGGNGPVRTVNIIVRYKFTVNEIVYQGQEVIPSQPSTDAYIHYLLAYPNTDISIKYSSKDPNKSQIIIQ